MADPNYEVTKGEIHDGWISLNWKWMNVLAWATLGYAMPIRNSRNYQCWIPSCSHECRQRDEKFPFRDFITKIGPENGTPSIWRDGRTLFERRFLRWWEETQWNSAIVDVGTIALLDELTLVWISMPLKWFQRGQWEMRGEFWCRVIVLTTNVFKLQIHSDGSWWWKVVSSFQVKSWACCAFGAWRIREISRSWVTTTKKNSNLVFKLNRIFENQCQRKYQTFSEMHAEPQWLQDLRQRLW